MWLLAGTNLLIALHRGIHHSHGTDPSPRVFGQLNRDEQHLINLFWETTSSLTDFFTDFQSSPDTWELCLHCLEQCHIDLSKADWELVLKSCDQDIRTAQCSIAAATISSFSEQSDRWVMGQLEAMQETFIRFLISDNDSVILLSLEPPPCLLPPLAPKTCSVSAPPLWV